MLMDTVRYQSIAILRVFMAAWHFCSSFAVAASAVMLCVVFAQPACVNRIVCIRHGRHQRHQHAQADKRRKDSFSHGFLLPLFSLLLLFYQHKSIPPPFSGQKLFFQIKFLPFLAQRICQYLYYTKKFFQNLSPILAPKTGDAHGYFRRHFPYKSIYFFNSFRFLTFSFFFTCII